MTDKELKKLNRRDLLEILLEVVKENDLLQQKVCELTAQLAQRQKAMEHAGSMADAPLQGSGVFMAAEESTLQYRKDLQLRISQQEQLCQRMEQQTRERCQKMLEDARRDADAYWEETWQKIQQQTQSGKKKKGKYWSGAL